MPSVSRSDASQPPSGCFLRGVRKHSDGWCKASEWGVDDVRIEAVRGIAFFGGWWMVNGLNFRKFDCSLYKKNFCHKKLHKLHFCHNYLEYSLLRRCTFFQKLHLSCVFRQFFCKSLAFDRYGDGSEGLPEWAMTARGRRREQPLGWKRSLLNLQNNLFCSERNASFHS